MKKKLSSSRRARSLRREVGTLNPSSEEGTDLSKDLSNKEAEETHPFATQANKAAQDRCFEWIKGEGTQIEQL